ncbi:MAG: recombinase family protein [Rickettsia endosymbiont of Pentastiridius leporinus]
MFLAQRKVPKKAVVFSRVSHPDQDDGYSLDGQKFRSESYCVRNDLETIKVFTIVESSTVGKRKKFMEAIKFTNDYAKKHKEIIAVVTDKVDRLQRSFKECVMLSELIEQERIELHFPADSCVIHRYSTSQEKMIWNIWVMMAQNYVDSLRDNVKRSIEQKLRCGEWISTAPIGYLHDTDQSKKGTDRIYVDPARLPFIKKIFELYASGLHTLPEILKMTKGWGLTNSRGHQGYLCRSHIFEIIQNPFYYGVMKLQKTGQLFPHIYPPIISKELFDKCQDVRLGRKQSSYKYREKEFIFRGLIKCGNTGKVATSLIKKGVYTYLMVWDANNHERPIYIREEKILEEVEAVLVSLQLAPEFLQEIIAYIKNSVNAEHEY